MDKKLLYSKAYRMLNDCTPLKFDCGLLCSSKCCKGDDYAGMCFYPGEYEIFRGKQDFLKVRYELLEEKKVPFGVCQGTCSRKYRPLACRIYPLLPYLDSQGRLTIINDPRARYICPLLAGIDEFKIPVLFKRKVYKLFELLCLDEEIKEYIRTLSSVAEAYNRFIDI